MPSILIVDDHLMVRQGLKQLLSQEYRDLTIGEAKSVDEALTQVKKRLWDLVVLDITMPDRDGFVVLQAIHMRQPAARVLIYSMHDDLTYAARAFQLGAMGYLSKSAGRGELVKALKCVMAGKEYFSKFEICQDDAAPDPPHLTLSAREYRVLLGLAAGQREGQIAEELNLSIKTVSTYKRRVLDKMRLSSTADLVRYVIDHQLQ